VAFIDNIQTAKAITELEHYPHSISQAQYRIQFKSDYRSYYKIISNFIYRIKCQK